MSPAFLIWEGGLLGQRPSLVETPEQRPHGQRPHWTEIPRKGIWVQAARQEVTSYTDPPLPVNRMTDTCKSTTLSQTSFAGSNKNNELATQYDFSLLHYYHT